MKTIQLRKLFLGMATLGVWISFPAVINAENTVSDYSKGFFIVNEDWFGHSNGTVNYIDPDATDGDNWHYRVFQAENPGMQLGLTAQAGQIWNGKFYIICKQVGADVDGNTVGGRINVADAKTMKAEYQLENIAPEGAEADGRGFAGIDEHKGYVSSSNGIWILNLDTHEVTGQVEGTASEDGGLYAGQSGTMVLAAGKVFAVHQSAGVLVIDPVQDKVTDVISMEIVEAGAGVGSIVLAKDGSLWASVAASNGSSLPYLVRIDPNTLQTEVVAVTEGCKGPANTWFAWTPDGFCASAVTNTLYWNNGSSSWAAGAQIFKFDIATRTTTKIIDFDEEGAGWGVYGCSMRVHPVTDLLYMTLAQGWSDKYTLRSYDTDGNLVKEYPMIDYYWFSSVPVFPQADPLAAISDVRNDFVDNTMISATTDGGILVENAGGQVVEVYTVSGSLLYRGVADSDIFRVEKDFPSGIVVVKAGQTAAKLSLR